MSDTKLKLEEAKYFLDQMKLYVEDSKIFAFNLSAFLSAARSVTFVMQSEYNSPKFKEWYKKKQIEMKRDGDFKFFNDLRRTTIHRTPILPRKNTEINIFDIIFVSECVTIRVINKESKLISKQLSSSRENIPQKTKVTVKNIWYFEERPNENLLDLCDKYLEKIDKLVKECQNQFNNG